MKKKIVSLLIVILLFLVGYNKVEAKDYALSQEYASGDVEVIPDWSYVFGSYLFTDSSSRSDMNLVLASRSAYADDMYMAFFGSYIATYGFSEDNAIYERGNIICIDHLNGERIDTDCPGGNSGGGSGGGTGEYVKLYFYRETDDGTPVRIGNPQLVEVGTYINVAQIPSQSIPSRTGYIIDGWYIEDDATESRYNFNNAVSLANAKVDSSTGGYYINFYVRYRPVNYTINYDFNGGQLANGATQYPVSDIKCNPTDQFLQSCITFEETPEKQGYDFKGWSVEANGSNIGTDPILVGGNEDLSNIFMTNGETGTSIILRAVWALHEYNIKYYLNGGSIEGELKGYFNVENNIDLSAIKPTRTGYTFNKWTAEATGGTQISTTSGRTSDFSVYAQWEAKTVKIRYYNGTTQIGSPQDCEYDNCTVERDNATKSGYTFLYWEGSDGQVYQKNDRVVATSNLNLTAKFNDGNYYDIEYILGDNVTIGSASVSKYQYTGTGTSVTLPTPSKPGYSFTGWSVSSDSDGFGNVTDLTTLTITRVGNVIVIPNFNPNNYTVTYNYYHNGQQETGTMSCTYVSCTAPTVNYLYNNLPIKYWMGNDSKQYGQGDPIIGLDNDLTLTAVYDSVSGYNIRFYDGNTQLSGYMSRYSSDYAFHLPVPIKTGYRFDGWKDKGQATNTPNYGTYLPMGTAGDKDLEAIWTPLSITVNYDLNYDGAPSIDSKTCYLYDSSCVVGQTPSARSGYEFLGWSVTNNNSALLSSNSDLFGIVNGATSIKLHAIWKTVDYAVIYNLNGGEFKPTDLSSITYFANLDSPQITMVEPVREGYEFSRWTSVGATVSSNTSATLTSASNATLTAVWRALALTVTFKNGDATIQGTVTSICTYEGCTINTPDPVRGGYKFKYWTTDDGEYIFHRGDTIVGFYGSLTLHAVFNDEDTNTITYNTNGGQFTNTPIAEYVTGVGTNLPVPTRDGYTFGGWIVLDARGRDTNEILNSIPNTRTGNISLKAKWDVASYEVKTISHLGTNTTSVNFGSQFTFPAAPTAPDSYHVFAGWKEAVENGVTHQPGDNVIVNSAHTYVATWTITTQYSIGYVLNGGEYGTNHPYEYTLNSEDIYISNPTKTGYHFMGWTETNNKATIAADGKLQVTTTGNLEFTASWQQYIFDIEYDYDGGVAENQNYIELDTNNTGMLQLNAPTKANYEFTGWEVIEGTASVVNSNLMVTGAGNIKLKANYRQVIYNITYDLAGGSVEGTNPPTYNVDNVGDITITAPTKQYHTFTGWSSNVEGITVSTNGRLTVSGNASDVTLTATYAPTVYTVSFVEREDGQIVNTYTTKDCTFGVACPVDVTSPTKPDRDFKYWKSNVGTIYPEASQIYAMSDMTLEAEWSSIYTYDITYDLFGGEFIGNVVRQYNHGDDVTLPTADYVVKEGYTFNKWSETESCDGEAVTQITGGTSNKHFYACYTPNTYNIGYYTDNTYTEVYDNNSGTYAYGSTQTVPTYVGGEINQVFIHWRGNDNRIYAPGETLIVTGDLNLYPEFYTVIPDEPLPTHSITYNFNGGSDVLSGSLAGRYTEGDTFELGTITREGFVLQGWYDENNELVTSVEGKNTDLVLHAVWTATRYTINFYVGSELKDSVTINHGESYAKHHYLDTESADASAVDANTGDEVYYFASGWAYFGGTEVVFPYEYDFGQLVTESNVVDLSAVINPNDQFVDISMAGYIRDQESNTHFVGIGTVGLYAYGSTMSDLTANSSQTWYLDDQFTQEVDTSAIINDSNYNLTIYEDPQFPQLKFSTEIYLVEDMVITNYNVVFTVNNRGDYGEFTCHYTDEYCDLSSVVNPTREGYEFLGWQANVQGVEFNEHLVYTSLAEWNIEFTPIWGRSNYNITFFDGETSLGTISYTYGEPDTAGHTLEVNRGNDENPVYYFVEGWATSADSTEVVYGPRYDFTHLVTQEENINLYTVVDVANTDYVAISWGIKEYNQDGLPYYTAYGADSYFKLGETLNLNRIDNRTWYSDHSYQNAIEDGLELNETNYDFISSCDYQTQYPQVSMCGTIYGKNIVESLSSYTINFYDTDNTTILKTVDITYERGYYGYNNSLSEVNGISGWALYPDEGDHEYQYDFMYDFSRVPTTEDEINLYAVSDPSDNLVDVTYHIYYGYPDGTFSPIEQDTGHVMLRYEQIINKDLFDKYFGVDSTYYKINSLAENYQIDFTKPLDNTNWYLSFVNDGTLSNVRYKTDVYVKVPVDEKYEVRLIGHRTTGQAIDPVQVTVFKGNVVPSDTPITTGYYGRSVGDYTWYKNEDKTDQVDISTYGIFEEQTLYGFR